MKVRFYEPTKDGGGTQEMGAIVLRNGILVAESSQLIIENLLMEPLFIYDKGKEVEIDPKREPERFLRALPRAVRGSYFWAGEVEE